MGSAYKLSDSEKKTIIALRADGVSTREIAQRVGRSQSSVMKVIHECGDLVRMCEDKKQENTRSMLDYLESQNEAVQKLLGKIIEAMGDPQKLARANVRDLATAYGILVDKHTAQAQQTANDNELLQSLIELERARREP